MDSYNVTDVVACWGDSAWSSLGSHVMFLAVVMSEGRVWVAGSPDLDVAAIGSVVVVSIGRDAWCLGASMAVLLYVY